jgi:catechol 2,3-dioxygenase-like lactoylglutathione lyase family enzyme
MEIRICIDVDDLERAFAFYTGGLGLRLGRRLGDDWAELIGASSPIDLLANARARRRSGPAQPQRTGLRASLRRQCTWTSLWNASETPRSGWWRWAPYSSGQSKTRRLGRMANMADPFGHGLDLLEFKGRGYDEILNGPVGSPMTSMGFRRSGAMRLGSC